MITKLNLFLIINTFVLCFSFLNAQTWNTFNTAYGYIQLGPANIDWAHIYTDRPKFIFNKDIYSMNGGFSSYNSNDLLLKTHGITRLSINSNNGFVGIGTTSPTRMLDVIGDSKINGELKINSNLNYDWGYGLSVWINRDKTKAFTINSNSTGVNLFTIWGNGIVNAKKIYAEEVEVRVDAIGVYWPDYVFKRDYELTPLNELEDYLIKYKHLPGVPSANEIYKEGLNLGEMDVILLKKIEELTLYIIKQQKEITYLKELIDK